MLYYRLWFLSINNLFLRKVVFFVKKLLALVMALCLTLGCTTALAAGKLTVNQEAYLAMESYSFIGYIFAEVENTGDKNIEFANGLLEILTADGEPMTSADLYTMYPNVLAPGEKGYIYKSVYVDDAKSLDDIADHMLTLTGKSSQEEATPRLESSAVYALDTDAWGDPEHVITVTLTNNTQETVYDCQVVYGLYDVEGKLLCVDYNNAYNIGIPAGQTIEYRFTVNDDIAAAWTAQGLTPDSAQSVVYPD